MNDICITLDVPHMLLRIEYPNYKGDHSEAKVKLSAKEFKFIYNSIQLNIEYPSIHKGVENSFFKCSPENMRTFISRIKNKLPIEIRDKIIIVLFANEDKSSYSVNNKITWSIKYKRDKGLLYNDFNAPSIA